MSEAKPSNSRVKPKTRLSKTAAKTAKAGKTRTVEATESGKPTAENAASPYPVFDLSEAAPSPAPVVEEPAPATEWPQPETVSSGDSAVRDNPKRKRRRKKGKGGQQNAPQPGSDEAPAINDKEERESAASAPRQSPQPRPKLDAEMVSKLAWKIYLAEVSEEGVALIGDNDAKELSRRCFRLAEIFMEEQARRR